MKEMLIGPRGRAWGLPLDQGRKPHAALAAWLLQVPGAHPVWSHYFLQVIHLRPVPGLPAPHKVAEDATHEFVVYAVDSGENPDPERMESIQILHPVNVVAQVSGMTDEVVVQVLKLCALACLDGRLNPEPTAPEQEFWLRAILGTAEHYLVGVHTAGGNAEGVH